MAESIFIFDEIPFQNDLRWFVRRGSKTKLMRGFKSKDEASTWINSLGHRLEWRAGYIFRLRGDSVDMAIVNRAGEVAKV